MDGDLLGEPGGQISLLSVMNSKKWSSWRQDMHPLDLGGVIDHLQLLNIQLHRLKPFKVDSTRLDDDKVIGSDSVVVIYSI